MGVWLRMARGVTLWDLAFVVALIVLLVIILAVFVNGGRGGMRY